MPIRAMKMPADLDTLAFIGGRAFVYPENPAWTVDPDEKQSIVETVKNAKRMWPIVRVLQAINPSMRDMFIGLVWEDDGQPVGLTQYQKPGALPVWHLNTVAVLPEHRRKGIARRLVQATLDDLRARGATVCVLGVIDGNLPAYTLYQSLGFTHFSGDSEYWYNEAAPPAAVPLPAGYTSGALLPREGNAQVGALSRFTPAGVQEYVPVDPTRFVFTGTRALMMGLFELMQGARLVQAGIRDSTAAVVGWYQLHARVKAGAVNRAHVWLDPAHATVAPFLVRSLIADSLRRSPGIRQQISIDSWETALLDAAVAAGCVRRLEYHMMGVRL